MKNLSDYLNKEIGIYLVPKTRLTGTLRGISREFIYLENTTYYSENLRQHVSFGNNWYNLNFITQIHLTTEDNNPPIIIEEALTKTDLLFIQSVLESRIYDNETANLGSSSSKLVSNKIDALLSKTD